MQLKSARLFHRLFVPNVGDLVEVDDVLHVVEYGHPAYYRSGGSRPATLKDVEQCVLHIADIAVAQERAKTTQRSFQCRLRSLLRRAS